MVVVVDGGGRWWTVVDRGEGDGGGGAGRGGGGGTFWFCLSFSWEGRKVYVNGRGLMNGASARNQCYSWLYSLACPFRVERGCENSEATISRDMAVRDRAGGSAYSHDTSLLQEHGAPTALATFPLVVHSGAMMSRYFRITFFTDGHALASSGTYVRVRVRGRGRGRGRVGGRGSRVRTPTRPLPLASP